MHVLHVDDDRVQAPLFAEACRMARDVGAEAAGSGAEAPGRTHASLAAQARHAATAP